MEPEKASASGIKEKALQRHFSKVVSCGCKSTCKKKNCSDVISKSFQESALKEFWGALGKSFSTTERKERIMECLENALDQPTGKFKFYCWDSKVGFSIPISSSISYSEFSLIQRQPTVEICETQYINIIGLIDKKGQPTHQWRDAKRDLLNQRDVRPSIGTKNVARKQRAKKSRERDAIGTHRPKFDHALAWIQAQRKIGDTFATAGT